MFRAAGSRFYNAFSSIYGIDYVHGRKLMRYLCTVPVESTALMQDRDFITIEDELPAEVALRPDGPLDRGTRLTDVNHETTDDN